MPKVTDRCTGHCCEMFILPYSPGDIWAMYRRWSVGGDAGALLMNDAEQLPNPQDIHLIAPMVEYLGAFDEPPMKHIIPGDRQLLGKKLDPPGHYYRCKLFDQKKRTCTIYEFRPVMCRGYPYGKPCNYAACTWKENKAKKETKKELAERLRVLQEAETKRTDPGGEYDEPEPKPKAKPIDINETINVVALVNELNDKRRAELVAQLESVKPRSTKRRLGRGMADLIPTKRRKR